MEEKLGNGLVIVDKPAGPQSNQVSVWVKELLDRGKAGHSGTLDPQVTGVLPVALDSGTKVTAPLSQASKEYVCVMELDEEREAERIKEVGDGFVGAVKQVPPEKSAVKREEREREIYGLDILEVDGRNVLFRLGCEKGFYVRTFCRQFGEELGTNGEMAALRRTRVAGFIEDDCVTLQELADQYNFWQEGEDNRLDDIVLPVEAGIRHLKKIVVKDSAVAALAHGAELGSGGIAKLQEGIQAGEMVAILTLKGELVATAEAQTGSDAMAGTDCTAAVLDRVYIDKDEYPKEW